MTNNVLLISESQLKSNSIINNNIDLKLILPSIFDCQNIQIQSVIGSGLYNELINQIKTSAVTSDNKILLEDYIQPALKNYVIADLYPEVHTQMRNGGVSQLQGDTFQTADYKILNMRIEDYKNKGEYYANQLKKFLCANPDKYPLYNNPGSTADTIYPNKTPYQSGIYFPKRK